jgi:pimeloyl-ACP methyl ester carboxylesterase
VLTELTRETHEGPLAALTRQGEGTPLVLVHGAMADAYAWTKVVNSLAPERPVLLPNRRGRKPSSQIGDSYSVETEVEDLLAWLETLPGPVHVAGHSYGGLIATEAIRRGAAARSLVLYEPVPVLSAQPRCPNSRPPSTTATSTRPWRSSTSTFQATAPTMSRRSGTARIGGSSATSQPPWRRNLRPSTTSPSTQPPTGNLMYPRP